MSLCGNFDENLKQIEKRLDVDIKFRGNQCQVVGSPVSIKKASHVINELYKQTEFNNNLSPDSVHLMLQESRQVKTIKKETKNVTKIGTKTLQIEPRTKNQKTYVENIFSNDITFGIGPAGTGKTYLAVACAAMALEQGDVRRIILVRPAVEAGERLGFLPGDLAQKVDPYLRPLYDGLYDMFGAEVVSKYLEQQVIEIAPLAYMRGRTLNDAFIILDESQNTTIAQMKMFLTRIGFSSKVVITGDKTQVDLPKHEYSGLKHAVEILDGIKGIEFTHLDSSDVVRHPVVQRIIDAYNKFDKKNGE